MSLEARVNVQENFDFLIGLKESVAYEIGQEYGKVVRIVARDGIPALVTSDLRLDRLNLHVVDNTVVAWTVG